MIYQCYDCKRLYDEDDGAMVVSGDLSAFPIPVSQTFMAFRCKNCMTPIGRKIVEKIQMNKKNKSIKGS